MLIKSRNDKTLTEAEVTPESIYLSRRDFISGLTGLGLAAGLPGYAFARSDYDDVTAAQGPDWFESKLADTRWEAITAEDDPAPFHDAAHYNNFYEFGSNKDDPARYAGSLQTEPWSVVIDGEVGRPGRYALEDLAAPHQFEERIYRLRCVEAWSMVIPWLGIPLAKLIERVEPTGNARFVRFETLADPQQMRAVGSPFGLIDWPYVEGLRLDEAKHPLAFLALGMYGRVLPNQNGAPFRLVVPWKYGFKSIKSIVRISLVEEAPRSSWMKLAPNEYGFYANVNPEVDHPRWSQATERRLPNSLFNPNIIDTQLFNGYAEEVASLYQGMDLRTHF